METTQTKKPLMEIDISVLRNRSWRWNDGCAQAIMDQYHDCLTEERRKFDSNLKRIIGKPVHKMCTDILFSELKITERNDS